MKSVSQTSRKRIENGRKKTVMINNIWVLMLQENHDLISDIAREESTEAAALPKLLLDLIEQVEGGKASQKQASGENDVENNGETDRKEDDLQEENIAHNLPKVLNQGV